MNNPNNLFGKSGELATCEEWETKKKKKDRLVLKRNFVNSRSRWAYSWKVPKKKKAKSRNVYIPKKPDLEKN